jgi:hypothetical protein
MKNELSVLQNEIKSGATRDYSKLKEVLNSQKIFDNRLQKSIYPRTDAAMVGKLKSQGYNVESGWFQEYRNACSSGVNADRDLGLMAQYEKMLREKTVSRYLLASLWMKPKKSTMKVTSQLPEEVQNWLINPLQQVSTVNHFLFHGFRKNWKVPSVLWIPLSLPAILKRQAMRSITK